MLVGVVESPGQQANRRLREGLKDGLVLSLGLVVLASAVMIPVLLILGPAKSFVPVLAVTLPIFMVVAFIAMRVTSRRLARKWSDE